MGQTIIEKVKKYWRKKKNKSIPDNEQHLGVLQKLVKIIFK